ncbi:MAG: xanthine dehydrogenase family protein molybdopterin-binding subunit [Isosphaeraceae bacterium]
MSLHNETPEVAESSPSAIEFERYELREGPAYHFALDRRDFLRGLGGGLLVLYLLDRESPDAEAQESGGRLRGGFGRTPAPQDVGAWLHIGEDGKISVFTGKAEVGQNIRTSLTQAVAEELRVPISAVTMVMADTRLTPFDMGTFGSRTTPDMSRRLHRAAAAAREALVDLAAETWKVDRQGLSAKDGAVHRTATGETLAYGKLTGGRKLTRTVTDDTPTTPPEKWTISGHDAAKVNGRSFVNGAHQYSCDIRRPGMWYGKVLRPPTYHASLVSVDLSPAQAMSDVKVVRDGDFIGVIAPSEQLAARAIAAIKAQWKPGPAISDRNLFRDLKGSGSQRPAERGGRRGGGPNGNAGSIADGLAAADVRSEETYTIAYIAHAPLEPRAAVAEWVNGELTVWTGTQRPFGVRGELTGAFKLPESRVRVIVPDTGSGYGGKHTGEAAVEAARLAREAGRPVKLVWTREEEFTWAYFRPAGVIEIKAGVKKDGTITAWEFHNHNSGPSGVQCPYRAASEVISFHQSQSPLRQGSYRALASTANHFARESHVDDLARAIGMDPLAFRLKNLKDSRMRDVLEAAARAFGWDRKAESGRGVGIAVGMEKGGFIATCAEVAVDRSSGRVQVLRAVSAFDCGAVVNPDHLKNQIEGALVMGLGGALFEAIAFDDGKIQNPKFSKYRVPRFRDVPEIEVVLIDRKDVAPAGAGETPIVAIAPAVGNAIRDATGVRLRSMPMVPRGLKV